MNKNYGRILFAVICLFMFTVIPSCGPTVKPTPSEPETAKLSSDEQNALAMVDFEAILDMTTKYGKRNVIPQLEEAYRDIIRKYPDSYVAQESYWRLVELNLTDQFPPKMDRAEEIRMEFLKQHPDSNMILPIDDSMARFYYKNREWDRLLNILSIHIREYIKTGKLNGPLFMFFYSEAKYNLNDLVEARKGYRIVVDSFPSSAEAGLSKERIATIDEMKAKTDQ